MQTLLTSIQSLQGVSTGVGFSEETLSQLSSRVTTLLDKMKCSQSESKEILQTTSEMVEAERKAILARFQTDSMEKVREKLTQMKMNHVKAFGEFFTNSANVALCVAADKAMLLALKTQCSKSDVCKLESYWTLVSKNGYELHKKVCDQFEELLPSIFSSVMTCTNFKEQVAVIKQFTEERKKRLSEQRLKEKDTSQAIILDYRIMIEELYTPTIVRVMTNYLLEQAKKAHQTVLEFKIGLQTAGLKSLIDCQEREVKELAAKVAAQNKTPEELTKEINDLEERLQKLSLELKGDIAQAKEIEQKNGASEEREALHSLVEITKELIMKSRQKLNKLMMMRCDREMYQVYQQMVEDNKKKLQNVSQEQIAKHGSLESIGQPENLSTFDIAIQQHIKFLKFSHEPISIFPLPNECDTDIQGLMEILKKYFTQQLELFSKCCQLV